MYYNNMVLIENTIKTKLIAVSEIVKRLIFDYGKYNFAEKLGISKNTLDNRLKNNDWTYREKLIIDFLSKK